MRTKFVVLHVITSLGDGGAEAVLYRICKRDSKNKHIVVSLTGRGKYGPLLEAEGIEVHGLELQHGRLAFKGKGIKKLYSIIKANDPDVVQTWMYHADFIGGIVARLAGARGIFWGIRNCNLTKGTVKNSTLALARINAYLSHFIPFKIVSCSERATIAHQEIGYAKNKFELISNGYDLNRFSPNPDSGALLRSQLRTPEGVPLIGMVARYDPQKDHTNLVAALEILHRRGVDFYCVLVGSGVDNSNKELVMQIKNAGISEKVRLLGRTDDVPSFMCAIDLHVLSSLGEAFPNVLAEAMACGTPCVTTDVGDAAMIVGDTGWVVPPQASEKLADAIEVALEERSTNQTAWNARKVAVRKRVIECFALDKMVSAYETVWNSVRTESDR